MLRIIWLLAGLELATVAMLKWSVSRRGRDRDLRRNVSGKAEESKFLENPRKLKLQNTLIILYCVKSGIL